MQTPTAAKNNILYINHLRVLLTILVILHHTFITYGASGSWYFTQKTTHTGALIPMTMFVAVNQSFFMGFFFFFAAFFSEPSYRKKGAGRFMLDRLKRLGLPLVFYSLVLSPCMNYAVARYGRGVAISFRDYINGYDDWIDFGVLWFTAALLVFSLIYVLVKPVQDGRPRRNYPLPSDRAIFIFALAVAAVSYVVRMVFPLGWVLHPLGFQLGYFPQYIALFWAALIASKNNWLEQTDSIRLRKWVVSALLFIVSFPCLYIIMMLTKSPLSSFAGAGTWQSLLLALWEQLTGMSIIVVLLCLGKRKWNRPSPLLQRMARSAYGVYIIHPAIVIGLALAVKNLAIDPAIKLLLVAPPAILLCFLAGEVLVKIPGVKNII